MGTKLPIQRILKRWCNGLEMSSVWQSAMKNLKISTSPLPIQGLKLLKYTTVANVLIAGILTATGLVAEPYGTAVLQALDKVTARVSTFEAPVGTFVQFGSLHVVARTCNKRPPEETPESAAFLDISEVRPGESTVTVYRGWMFSSSRALAAMEHPIYDVWVLDCKSSLKASFSSSTEILR